MAWDIYLFNWIHGLAGWSVFTDSIGIFFANYLPYLLGIAAIVFAFRQSEWRSRIRVFLHLTLAAVISRGIFAEIIHYVYDRPRPFAAFGFTPLVGESGSSFPSGHASFFFALAFVIMAVDKRWGWWFLGLSFLNGLARIFVGVHYPTDILGGILVGFISWFIISALLKKRENAELQEVQPATGGGD